MRIWAKTFKNNHMLRDIVITNEDPSMTRTKKVFAALEDVCMAFDLSVPLWLDVNIADFKRNAKTRFRQDSFVDHIEIDFLEFHVIEED